MAFIDINKLIKDIEPNVPCYLFDADKFKANIFALKEALGNNVSVVFSAKANPYFIPATLNRADGIEVCSYGELSLLPEGSPFEERVTFGGIYKSNAEWELAVKQGVRRFSIESVDQLLHLESICSKNNLVVNVVLRISSGNQFGMNIDEAIDSFSKYRNSSFLKIKGIHYYSGTMKSLEKEIIDDFDNLNRIISAMPECDISEIQYGAGIAVDYYSNLALKSIYDIVVEKTKQLAKKYRIIFEVGRYLAANCGVYVARIVEIKKRACRNYIVLNGGGHHFTYYNSIFNRSKTRPPDVSVISQHDSSTEKKTYTVVGALCSAGDILATDIDLDEPTEGDYVVFHKAGAYCSTECMSLFLSRDIPAVYIVENLECNLLRRRTQLGEGVMFI